MVHVLFLLIGLWGASEVLAEEQSCGSQAMMTMTKADGSKIGLFILPTQISNSPAWSPETGEPPLPVSKAVQLATEWAKKEHKRFDGVQVRGINLGAYGCPTPKDRWYYTVHFVPVVETIPLMVPGYFVAVLMDGTIIGPRLLSSQRYIIEEFNETETATNSIGSCVPRAARASRIRIFPAV